MWFFILLGAAVGFLVFDLLGQSPILGALTSALFVWVIRLSQHTKQLQQDLTTVKQQLLMRQAAEPLEEMEERAVAPALHSVAITPAKPAQVVQDPLAAEPVVAITAPAPPLTRPAEPPKPPNLLEQAWQKGRDWLFGGNPFVRVGIILVFFGFVFLLRYSLEHNLIPVELRLLGSAAGAIALLGAGWRFRQRAGAYGLILQAGGIGLLYLTVFGAFSLYHVLPALPALLLLVVIVILAASLAVLQNSLPFAVFATVGGFLAPLLTSSGSNNYIGLFSFYALLNLGIVIIAWFKTWRILNLIGFIFTFVIASIWGWFSYRPDFFVPTEGFLILFFLFYVAISILFALRTPPNFKDKVDSSLVFGVPLVGFGMQIALVKAYPYGIAISALVLGAFYFLLSYGLWQRYHKAQQLLAETFLALSVIFITLAIPFAVDGNLTSAMWAIEGAGILWISIRQQQFGRRLFALFLQYAALLFWLVDTFGVNHEVTAHPAFWNGSFFALLLIAVAMFAASWLLSTDFAGKRRSENDLALVLFMTAWLAQAVGFEWQVFESSGSDGSVVRVHIIYAIVWAMLLSVATRLPLWRNIRLALPTPLLALGLGLFLQMVVLIFSDRSAEWLWWPGFASVYAMLYLYEQRGRFITWLKPLQIVLAWEVILLATLEVATHVHRYFADETAWAVASWAIVGLGLLLVLTSSATRRSWPFSTYSASFLTGVAVPLASLLGVWLLLSGFAEGDSASLPWLPVLNPLDLATLAFGLGLVRLYHCLQHGGANRLAAVIRYSGVALGFYALNVLTLRCLHYGVGLPWSEALFMQPTTQTTLAIVWTLSGMALTWRGHQKANRTLWIGGAALLGVVVLKLFLVDFASSGTLARVISFISVGVLLLFIGFFAPIPPARPTVIQPEEASV